MSELRMRTAEARALIRGATDAAFFDLLVSRRRAVSVGDSASAARYASAVSAAKRVFGAASEIWLRVRERASARRRPGGDDPAELAELRAAAEAKLKSSTDGSERARLIRAVADLRRKEHDKRAEARAAAVRAVTDLDASGLRSEILFLRSLAARAPGPPVYGSEDADDADAEEDDDDEDDARRYHDGADPLRWYD